VKRYCTDRLASERTRDVNREMLTARKSVLPFNE